jgi:hypothetical protein
MLIRGITREVFIFKDLVFKIPSLRSYKLFLTGLLANLQELFWWNNTKDKRLCPILFKLPLGLLIVMPYASPVKRINYKKFKNLPLDPHISNFGKYKNRVVLIDYGS